ncbi:MAG: phosphoribosylformimino-5-aminoimidazole carboxamide ribotide isomerase [Ruminococcus sp.]|nr:phosphoribosylformimino-5-aminoimidazole carboxamide ribotide isomerase [Ruminococcus sp.]
MRFRPCIDIHNGRVKQIVGSTLADKNSAAKDNFVSEYGAEHYAALYRSRGLSGGHVIILNPAGSEYYEADVRQAKAALSAYEGGLQIGGGINAENAGRFLDMGASHVIVTSFVFRNGAVDEQRLSELVKAVGRERLVLDLSCKKREDGRYYIVTDRWQKFTDVELNAAVLERFAGSCAEFLIHAADAEGKQRGIEKGAAEIMAQSPIPCTYAGGIASMEDIELLRELGGGRIDYTIGSALDIFGGSIEFEKIARI